MFHWQFQLMSHFYDMYHTICSLNLTQQPSNVFFTDDGTLKIGDFGLSRDRSSEHDRGGC